MRSAIKVWSNKPSILHHSCYMICHAGPICTQKWWVEKSVTFYYVHNKHIIAFQEMEVYQCIFSLEEMFGRELMVKALLFLQQDNVQPWDSISPACSLCWLGGLCCCNPALAVQAEAPSFPCLALNPALCGDKWLFCLFLLFLDDKPNEDGGSRGTGVVVCFCLLSS